ncbi:MAG TPA: hypothetical protein VKA00_02120 [Trueperaceae bacterium]|nr:hypothetical protein [Trueperaceae bacterium]
MNRARPVLRPLALVALLSGLLLASGAFAQGGASGSGSSSGSNSGSSSSTCRNLKQTPYWRVSYQITPMPDPVPGQTKSALDGFQVNTQKNSDGTITVDIERTGRSDNETNETPDQDDIKVDTSKQILYFLEGEMGDDAVGIDTHLNDEAVVLTDLNGCILQ